MMKVFVNANRPSWVNTQVIDQNRLFAGVDIPASKESFLEVGYLYQYIFSSPAVVTHVLSISWMIYI